MGAPRIRVLGPIEADLDGTPLRLTKPRHRELLGLLVAAHGRVVSTDRLVDELWPDPPAGAVGAVRTFVGELRRVLEPDRPPRTDPTVLVTAGAGYALRGATVDLWTVRDDEITDLPFEEFADRPWAQPERARLAALRADAVERAAEGGGAEVVPLLEQHVEAHPWRENGWRLLALALYRSERRAEALAVLRRARTQLVDELGLDPGPRLADLERDLLRGDVPDTGGSLLLRAATAHARSGARAQLESANALLPGLATSGGLGLVGEQRLAAIAAAEELGDAELTARIVGGFDVPGIWTRSDDPVQAAALVGAALRLLPTATGRTRARLLATVAMESRGTADRVAEADEAVRLARSTGDPQLLCFALGARWMQCFGTAGRAREREAIGAEVVAVATTAELPTSEIHGRLIRLQALCALDDVPAATVEADAVDALAARHERPLARVFTAWFRRTFTDASVVPPPADEMPGFAHGIAFLSGVTDAVRDDRPLPDVDAGPYDPWVRPLLLARAGRTSEAVAALDAVPDPPRDLLLEAMWCLVGRAVVETGHRAAGRRALDALRPAVSERAAGSGVVDLGSVAHLVDALEPDQPRSCLP
ncbi:BTAD domain-containing putative transcriptional regulator [Cellulomonas xylanilytica]|uniref:SARP family transcriptional regulator n=1 Tax=Cellulomonas xylanilytica TaxID=233583 RepID=A0A510V9D2_9CELL|nr:BTAD domain-containing putative transcriptional regulator [Cellulomonas xylanilytica]GEK21785.1 SARP family transcriptional regulator [Cellulomonas xylanilytica]